MGCDIHICVELREHADSPWQEINPEKWHWWSQEHGDVFTDTHDPPKLPLPEGQTWLDFGNRWYRDRNYTAFGILAGVRSHSVEPILEPRGLPSDVCDSIRAQAWGSDWHSHSYYTVEDLLAFDWHEEHQHEGYVDISRYLEFKKGELPWMYYTEEDVGTGKFRVVSIEELEAGLASGEFTLPKDKWRHRFNDSKLEYLLNPYVKIKWTESYKYKIGKGYWGLIESLKLLGEPENVRMVFWFDN
jgi:hypothetical protein